MKIIRQGFFETNSSSTHSMIIMSKEDYNKWNSDEVCFDSSNGSTVSFEMRNCMVAEIILYNMYMSEHPVDVVSIDLIEKFIHEDGIWEYPFSSKEFDNWLENSYLEVDYTTYVTKNNESLKIICTYGHG